MNVEEDIFEDQANISLEELVAIVEQVENQEKNEIQETMQQEQNENPEFLQPEQDEQPKSLQLVLYEQQESVTRKILVGIHKPPSFSWNDIALKLWSEMQRREETWKKEKHKL